MFLNFIASIISKVFFLFGYISNNNLFPPPLSKSEEEYYLKKHFAGDINAKNKLIEHNLRLVAHIAKKYAGGNQQEQEDYISIGSIGLIKAINSFKDDKGYKLSTYASKCIENEILMNKRNTKKYKAETSMNNIIGTDKDGNNMELEDVLDNEQKDTVDTIYDKMLIKQITEYVNKNLPEKEKQVMLLRFGLENNKTMTQQEVADKLNISRSYVSLHCYDISAINAVK